MLFIYGFIGVFAGFLGGLLGIGGGLVTVPSLVLCFYLQGYASTHSMQLAIGTSLGAMVFTAASSAIAHYLKKGIYWNLFWGLAPGIVLGAVLGAIIADRVSNRILELFFGFSECLIGIYFFFSHTSKEEKEGARPPHHLFLVFIGIAIGAFSTVLGIGGGIVTVPILTAFGTPFRNAISTSAMAGFLIAIIGAIAFLYLGLEHSAYQGSVGFVYVPAFIMIGITSALLAPYGAKCTYALPVGMLRRGFGVILIGAGISMIV